MAKSVLPLPVFCLLLFLLCMISGGTMKMVDGQVLSRSSPNSSEFFFCNASNGGLACSRDKTWCVAKPSTAELDLTNNIQFACNNINCSPIQVGGSCFYPDTTISHASVAMNLYYQANGRNYWNCYFGGSGLISFSDPSYGSCKYA